MRCQLYKSDIDRWRDKKESRKANAVLNDGLQTMKHIKITRRERSPIGCVVMTDHAYFTVSIMSLLNCLENIGGMVCAAFSISHNMRYNNKIFFGERILSAIAMYKIAPVAAILKPHTP